MERAEKNKMTKYEVLKKYFGYDSFREGQEMLVDALLNGQDVLGIMPTGAGKSLCYQIPALLLPGITLVVSPLISLMKDQVSTLNQAGIHAAFLNSSLSAAQYRKALGFAMEGRYKIIYVAPERLLTPEFLCAVQSMEISMISVDEAHCISQWGQDFRPSYLKITEFVEQLPARPVIGAFTATATKEVRDDIEALLSLRDPVLHREKTLRKFQSKSHNRRQHHPSQCSRSSKRHCGGNPHDIARPDLRRKFRHQRCERRNSRFCFLPAVPRLTAECCTKRKEQPSNG